MKTTDISRYMAAALMLLAVAACDDNNKQPEEVTGNNPKPLTVESVINEPKVGAPGDTLLFTAVVTSSSQNEGDFPKYAWTADGGTFVENNLQTVHWIAPATSGIYTITATATNDVGSANNHAIVFTGGGSTLIPDDAGQIDLIGTGPDFYFYQTPNVDIGVDVAMYNGGGVIDPIADANGHSRFGGLSVAYSKDGALTVEAQDSLVLSFSPRPRHIYVGDLNAGTQRRIDFDNGVALERNVFDYPTFSPNGQVVTYQGLAQSQDGVSPDSFHVYTYNLVANTRHVITRQVTSPRCWHPTFSTDGKWLTFVQDKNRSGGYDLYASPVTGNTVDENPANFVRMTDTGGRITTGAPAQNLARPVMTWNPVSSILAIVDADKNLHLVQTTNTGATDTPVPGVPAPVELIWSHDGTKLAATNGNVIYTVTSGGAETLVVEAPAGDSVRDMAFSPDGLWLVYRQGRGGGNWMSIADLGAGKLTAPVPVTPTTANGQVAKYRGKMSIKAAWTSANLIIYPVWGIAENGTPTLLTRDLSGLVD